MHQPQIVVGVDGSPSSRDALLWAFEHAKTVGGTLRVVYAWEPPAVATLNLPPMVMDWGALDEQAKAFPADFARTTIGEASGVKVIPLAVRGGPAQVLIDASRTADLLVVGSRGLGGLKGMILGSVGHHCAAHSQCPVVVVHGRKRPRQIRREPPKTLRESAAL